MRARLEGMLTFLTERLAMFTSEQYRAKAAEYIELVKTANTAKDVCEFQKLERSFTGGRLRRIAHISRSG
jgi:hypothetical protein